MAELYVVVNGQPEGPYAEEEVRGRLARGQLQPQTMYWSDGMTRWAPLAQWPGRRPAEVDLRRIYAAPQTHAVETPNLVDFGPRYAGFWIRVAAAVLDAIVMWVVGLPINLAIRQYMPLPQPPPGNPGDWEIVVKIVSDLLPFLLFTMAVHFLLQWLYFAIMESSRQQGTVGKLACGLKVTDLDGRRISFGKGTARYFAKHIVSNLLTFGVGFMFCGWTEKKQCLHDMMVGTLVVYRQPR